MREFLQSRFLKNKRTRGGGSEHVGGGLLTAPTAVRDEGLSEQEMTWPSRWETTTPAASNILGHYTRLRRAKQQIIANPGSEKVAGSILNEKPGLHMAGLDMDSLGCYTRPCWWTMLNAPRERTGTLGYHYCVSLYLSSRLDYWENKNCHGWLRTLDWQDKEWLALTSRYFSLNRPLCPCAPLTVGEDKQTVQSNVTRCPQNKSHPPWLDWQSLSLPSISSLLYSGQCHPHTRGLPHRSTENLYDITPPGLKRKSSYLQKDPGKGGKILPNGPYSHSNTVFYVSGVLVKKTSTRKHLFFWVLSPQKSEFIR